MESVEANHTIGKLGGGIRMFNKLLLQERKRAFKSGRIINLRETNHVILERRRPKRCISCDEEGSRKRAR